MLSFTERSQAATQVIEHMDSMHDAYNALDNVAHMLSRKLDSCHAERTRLMEECADLRARLARVTTLSIVKG